MTRAANRLVPILLVALVAPTIAGDDVAPPETFKAEQREHWAFQPVRRPALPEVKEARWVRNPIDRFIRASQEAMDFVPAPEADRVALIRRLTFDLTGLPPQPGRGPRLPR